MSLKVRFPRAIGSLVLFTSLALLPNQPAEAQQVVRAGRARLEKGRELFTHQWTVGDKLSPSGDGLGPMRNADSCIACHANGGSSGNSRNVQLLTVVRPQDPSNEKATKFRKEFRQRVSDVHPGFGISDGSSLRSTIVLHRAGRNADYDRFKQMLWGVPSSLDDGVSRLLAVKAAIRRTDDGGPITQLPGKNGVSFLLSERNSTALFGAGLIDGISVEVIQAAARSQSQDDPGISGRFAGRFGWRGHVQTLNDFVLAACAAELGLEVPGQHQHIDPVEPPAGKPKQELDLTAEQCDELTDFVANLPRPIRIASINAEQAVFLGNGEQLFHSIGCAACHMQRLGEVNDLFSDLLLHDMGESLEDPSPAPPESVRVGVTTSAYGGGSIDVFAKRSGPIKREWRTPPLWGVADSAPYLHDGRAANLDEAILLHDGEAATSASRYRSMSSIERQRLLAFLSTLRAPQATPAPTF